MAEGWGTGVSSAMTVLVVGGVSYNLMLYLAELPGPGPQTIFARRHHETVGSTGAGKALNLVKLGMDVILHGVIGDDEQGAAIIRYLHAANVPFVHDHDPRGTQRHVNLMDLSGARISIFAEAGSPDPDVDIARLASLVDGCELIVLNIANYCRSLIPIAQAHGKPIWCDIHDYDGRSAYHQDFIDAATVIFMSSDAMPEYRPFMQRLVAAGKQLVVCTHGRHGATALTAEGRWIEVPIADAYPLVDSNGAGDAFFAGYLWASLQGWEPVRCLRAATIVAGLCVTSSELAAQDLSVGRVQAEYERLYATGANSSA